MDHDQAIAAAVADHTDDPAKAAEMVKVLLLLSDEDEVEKHAEQQQQDWTCGPAALRWAASRLQDKTPIEDVLGLSADSNPDDGTSPDGLVSAAESIGLTAEGRHDMTLPQLGRACVVGHPVLCCIQSPDGDAADVASENAGHWVAVVQAGPRTVRFFDPATGEERTLSPQDFEGLWQDRDGDGVAYRRFGIVLGKGTATTP